MVRKPSDQFGQDGCELGLLRLGDDGSKEHVETSVRELGFGIAEAGMKKELVVALSPKDRRGNNVEVFPTRLLSAETYTVDCRGMGLRAAHDAALAHVLATGFELRLDEDDGCA